MKKLMFFVMTQTQEHLSKMLFLQQKLLVLLSLMKKNAQL